MKKKFFTMHTDLDAFTPATDAEKEYMVQMRPSSTFFKDGMRRLLKNKVATVSLIVIVVMVLSCVFIPMFWPYNYKDQLGTMKVGAVDASYNYLGFFEYGATEREKLIGKADYQTLFLPFNEEKTDMDQVKSLADSLAGQYAATDKSEASFAALQNGLTEGTYIYEETDGASPAVQYRTYKRQYNDSHNVEWVSLYEWVWDVNSFGKAQNATGDHTVLEAPDGYYLVRLGEYKGGGEFVFPHIFGTDHAGRDFFARVVYGTRLSLAVGFFASLIVLGIGLLMGSLAGYCGGKVDMIIMRIADIIYSIPDMVMVILIASVFTMIFKGNTALQTSFLGMIGGGIVALFVVFALLYWVSMARMIRGQILSLREQEYVLSARASGAKSGWIIRKHLLPNCISVIIISTALQIPSAIFTESYLSFLGLGVNAPMPSLGSLASDSLSGIYTYPEYLVIPAIVISLLVLSLNLLGDGLRDAFDPKLNS